MESANDPKKFSILGMVSVAKYAKAHGIECEVSLENRMACGVVILTSFLASSETFPIMNIREASA